MKFFINKKQKIVLIIYIILLSIILLYSLFVVYGRNILWWLFHINIEDTSSLLNDSVIITRRLSNMAAYYSQVFINITAITVSLVLILNKPPEDNKKKFKKNQNKKEDNI